MVHGRHCELVCSFLNHKLETITLIKIVISQILCGGAQLCSGMGWPEDPVTMKINSGTLNSTSSVH